ncbi:MAG: peptidase family [Candidatus Saccharibacteria bacterium]|nr:peptidase family [Candidatus Saccharibacteria bacterium]
MPTLSNQTELQLPFDGDWLCHWGGETKALNYHRAAENAPDQRFAFDFVKVDDFRNMYRGGQRTNEASLSYGKDILAPGAGVIVDAMGERRDNRPGILSQARNVFGNYVILGHSENEFSVLAHLRKGSLMVGIGETVVRGQKLAECGNSGRSSDPRLHYHLQDSPELNWSLPPDTNKADRPQGIKVYFSNILLDREDLIEPRKKHSPIKGDVVQQV